MPELRIGISGWTYGPWRGTFYPKGLVQKRELAYAARRLNSIEINGSFYSLQRPTSYQLWREETPDGFVFSVKGGRFITHMKRLREIEVPLANFFASGVLRLEEKLGPILWQFPPQFRFDPDRLASFFRLLPRDTAEAAALSRHHDERLSGRAWMRTQRRRPIRNAMEVRHESFKCAEFVDLLRRHDVALVVADTAGKWPFMEDVTSDFVYARLHGDEQLYVSGYSDAALDAWAEKIRAWSAGGDAPAAKLVGGPAKKRARGRDVYVYFDNDVKVRSPFDAMNLAWRLGVGEKPEAAPAAETIAELPRATWAPVSRGWRGVGRRSS